MTPTKQKPPITAAEVSPEWIAACRGAIGSRADCIRANTHAPAIDVRSSPRGWLPLMLPNSGVLFTSFEERNAVLERLRA